MPRSFGRRPMVAGSLAHAAVLPLSNKQITTAEGGVVTNDDDGKAVRSMRRVDR